MFQTFDGLRCILHDLWLVLNGFKRFWTIPRHFSIIEMGGRGGLNFSFKMSKIVGPRINLRTCGNRVNLCDMLFSQLPQTPSTTSFPKKEKTTNKSKLLKNRSCKIHQLRRIMIIYKNSRVHCRLQPQLS